MSVLKCIRTCISLSEIGLKSQFSFRGVLTKLCKFGSDWSVWQFKLKQSLDLIGKHDYMGDSSDLVQQAMAMLHSCDRLVI